MRRLDLSTNYQLWIGQTYPSDAGRRNTLASGEKASVKITEL